MSQNTDELVELLALSMALICHVWEPQDKLLIGVVEVVLLLMLSISKLLSMYNWYLAIPEVTSAAIVSTEGLPIAFAFPRGIDKRQVAAMTATLLSLSEKVILEIGKGDFDQLYIKGSEGYIVVMQAGPDMVLIVSTTKDVRLGLILLDCRRTCEKIAKIGGDVMMMDNDDDEDDDDEDDDDDRYPRPYILVSPESHEDFEMGVQFQVRKSMNKETENDIYCQYCGRKLTEEENISHNCRESPK